MPEDVEIDRAIQNVSDALAALDATKPTPGKQVSAVTVPGRSADQDHKDDEVRWLAMLVRQSALMLAKGIERKYGIDQRKDRAA